MAHRRRVSPKSDKRFFTRTAHRSKAININPIIYRGGIRL